MKFRRRLRGQQRNCLQCSKEFVSDFCFNLHSYVHERWKTAWFPCHMCQRKFSEVSKLIKHRATHSLHNPGFRSLRRNLLEQKKLCKAKVTRIQFHKNKKAAGNPACKRPYFPIYEEIQIKQECNVDILTEKVNLISNGLRCTLDEDPVFDNVFAKFGFNTADDDHVVNQTEHLDNEVQVHFVSSSNEPPSTTSLHSKLTFEGNSQKSNVDDSVNEYLETIGIYYCNICGKSFTRKVAKQKHWELCHMEEMAEVLNEPIEHDIEYKKQSLSRMTKICKKEKHGKRENICPKCGEDCKFPSWFSRHLQACKEEHNDDQTVKTRHKTNPEVRNFYRSAIQVHEGYGRKFNLEDIMDIKGPTKGHYPCNFCDKIFVFKSSLKRHLRFHTGETPYQCRVCSQRFALRKSCLAHVRKHKISELRDLKNDVSPEKGTSNECPEEKCNKRVKSKSAKPRKRHSWVDYSQNDSKSNQVEDTLSESEVQKILGPELDTSRRSCKKQSYYFFDDADPSDEWHPETSSKYGYKNKLIKNSLRGKKSIGSESSDDDFPSVAAAGSTTNVHVSTLRNLESMKSDLLSKTFNTNTRETISNEEKGKKVSSEIQTLNTAPSKEATHGKGDNSDDNSEISESEGFSPDSSEMNESDETTDSGDGSMSKYGPLHKKRKQVYQDSVSHDTKSIGGQKRSDALNQESDDEAHGHEHDGDHSNDLPYKCKTCNVRFVNKYVLRRHQVTNGHAKKSFQCPFCDRIYSNEGAFGNHMYVHKHKDEMVCKICNKQLLSLSTFQAHQRLHKKNPFACTLCNELFPSQLKLERHLASAHDEEKEFKCRYCFKTFEWRANFIRHLNKHTNVKQFVCGICSYSFNISSNLGRHIRQAHRGEVPPHIVTKQWLKTKGNDNICIGKRETRGRNEAFKTRHSAVELQSPAVNRTQGEDNKSMGTCHQKIDGPDEVPLRKKKHKCTVCSKICLTREGLSAHLRYAHQKDKNWDGKTVLIHYVIANETFICQVCGSTLSCRGSIMSHMRITHSLSPEDDDIRGVAFVEGQKPPRIMSRYTGYSAMNGDKNRNSDGNSSSFEQEVKTDRYENVCIEQVEDDMKINYSDKISRGSTSNDGANFHAKNSHEINADRVVDNGSKSKFTIKCTLCGRKFNTVDRLEQHLQTYHKIPESLKDALIGFASSISNIQFNEKSKTSTITDQHDEGAAEANAKTDKLKRRTGRRDKNDAANTKNMLVCPICELRFEDIKILEEHAAVCDAFKNKRERNLEERDRADSDTVEDDYDTSSYEHTIAATTLPDLSRKAADYRCELCDIDFYHAHALNRHKVFSPAHPKIGNIKCPTCKMDILAKEFKDHPCSGKRIQCKVCDVCFSTVNSLNRHMKCTHSDVKDFHCENCGKYFSRKTNLIVHLSTCNNNFN